MHERAELDPREINVPEGRGARLPWIAGGVGVISLILAWVLGAGHAQQLLFSYLTAYLFWLSLALGGLIFVLLQFITRAGWSVVVRRPAEHAMATLPLFIPLFLPIAFGLKLLYPWARPEVVAGDALLEHKSGYLDPTFFLARAALYLIVWALLAWWFRRQSLAQDASGDPSITRRLQSLSAPGIVLFALTVNFASFDWIMSLDPHWYSTVFGVYFFSGALVGIFSFLILVLLHYQRRGLLEHVVSFEHYHDLGKLLFAFVVFWAYIGFSQFMLIWYGNIPEETLWYAHRLGHGWKPVTLTLVGGHFVVPFFFLLLRDVKRHRITLSLAAIWMLAFHGLDLWWLVMPNLQAHGPHLTLLDAAVWVGIGGLFVAAFSLLSRRKTLIPAQDPRLAESLSFENV